MAVTASPSSPLDCGINLETVSLIVFCFYIVLFVPAVLLNILTVRISWNLKTKSSFIVYLKNLVAADLLMTLIIPLRAADRLPGSPWGLRAFNCQFGTVIFYLCMYVSIVLMGVISLDRFFKIVQPGGRLLGQSALLGKVVSAVIWIVLLSLNTIPTMVLTNQKPVNYSSQLCMNMKTDQGKQYHKVVIMFCNVIFFAVLGVIGFCYTFIVKRVIESHRNSGSANLEGKRKIKARVCIILVVFLVCFTPYHITRFSYIQWQVENKINCHWATLRVAKSITLWLSTTNVCLDPFIYFLLCRDFREKLCEVRLIGRWFTTTVQPNSEDTSP